MAVEREREDQDAAARAFEDMAAELTAMRRSVEEFGEKLDTAKARNYDATLGGISELQAEMSKGLTALASAPALKDPPESWARRMLMAGEGGRQEVMRELEGAKRQLADAGGQMERLIAQASTAEQQLRWQVIWGAGGVVMGVFLFLLGVTLLSAFPQVWALPEKFSAFVMHEDRWSAGEAIAQSADPQRWGYVIAGGNFEEANRAALQTCFREATKLRRPQRCAVNIFPGPAPHPETVNGAVS